MKLFTILAQNDTTSFFSAPTYFLGFIVVCFLLMVTAGIHQWWSQKKSGREDRAEEDSSAADEDAKNTKEETKRARREAKENKKQEKEAKKKEKAAAKAEAKAAKRGKKKKKKK